VLRLSVVSLTVCDVYIVAKRCVLEQKSNGHATDDVRWRWEVKLVTHKLRAQYLENGWR